MKVSVDDIELFSLNETQKKVIQDNVQSEIFDEDMKRRIQWIITHKYDECFKDLKNKWMPVISQRYQSIPTDADQLAELIISQPDYKNRSARDIEEKRQKDKKNKSPI